MKSDPASKRRMLTGRLRAAPSLSREQAMPGHVATNTAATNTARK